MKYHLKYIPLILLVFSLASAKTPPPGNPVDQQITAPAPLSPLADRLDTDNRILRRFYPSTVLYEKDILSSLAKEFGLRSPHLMLYLNYEKVSPAGLHRHFGQLYKNVKVKDAELVINTRLDGTVVSVFNSLHPLETELNVIPSITENSSRNTAFGGIDGNTLRAEEISELMIAFIDGTPLLCYLWEIPASEPYGDWEILIDANTGEKLSQNDLRVFIDGTGQVFIPDPKTAIQSDTLFDNGDANWAIPEESYSEVTLFDLEPPAAGLYYLDGAYCTTGPTADRAAEPTPEFLYLRYDDRFEEVNVYYHIDTYQRYIQYLGFDDILNYSFPFNVNGTTDDNSWFSPSTGVITFGSGGVDDAEDADVILHEYGHAIQYHINPGMGGGHTGAMGEGFGDYAAGTYSLVIDPDFHPEWVFTWDGHNEFWPGRVLNKPYHYPENAGGQIHDSGQLWSAGLIDVWYDVPDVEVWDMLVFQHHYYLGYGATMEDAANAVLLADIEINNAEYRTLIIDNFVERGFLNPEYLVPQFVHDPLPDTEDTLQAEFPVFAGLTSMTPLDTGTVQLHWGLDGVITESITMIPAGTDSFSAVIPGPISQHEVVYYLSAADTFGASGFSPAAGPPEVYSFYVGPDTELPVISIIDTLRNTVFGCGDEFVRAVVTDNIGLDEITLHYRVNTGSEQIVSMTGAAPDTFSAEIPWEALQTSDVIYYHVSARDNSSNQNYAFSSELSFLIVTEALFDDFESGLDKWEIDGSWNLQSVRTFSGAFALNDHDGMGGTSGADVILYFADPLQTAGLADLHLDYWTQYFLFPTNDTGFVEIETPSGWAPLDTVTGVIAAWEKRMVPFSAYLPADSLNVRFRTRINIFGPGSSLGWYLDDVIFSTEPLVETAKTPDVSSPQEFKIVSIAPNPGNGRFNFSFTLPQAGLVKAAVYDVLGRETDLLAEGNFNAGSHNLSWNGHASSGMYFLRIEVAGSARTAKFLLLK